MYNANAQNFQTPTAEYFGDQQLPNNHFPNGCGYTAAGPPARMQQKSRFQMNLCLVCNAAFVAEKADSKDTGIFSFLNLCNVLQVPTYQEFVPETNPMCAKCSGTVDEYLKLQLKIKELMNSLGEMRRLLGNQLVDSYGTTLSTMRNYEVKTKIYKVWYQKIHGGGKSKGQSRVASSESPQKSASEETAINPEGENVPVTTVGGAAQQQNENPAPANYTLLDISNSVSSSAAASVPDAVSAAGSMADNDNDNNSNLSMECPSPASPPAFDDGPSDHEKELYVKNLNDEADVALPGSAAKADGISNLKTEISSVTPSKEGQENVERSSGIDQASSTNRNEPQWIDKRRFRPIIVTQRRSHPCKFCGKLFPAVFSLQMHERTHTGEKPFKCSICDRGFANKAAMQKHELIHDKTRYEGEPKYECDLCGKKYHLERSLYTHKRDHMGIKRLKRFRKKYPKKKKAIKKDPNAPPKPKKPSVKKEGGQPKRASRKKVKKEVKLDEDGNPIPEEPKPKRRKRSPRPPSNRPKRQFYLPRRKPGTPKEAICQHCGKDFRDGYRLRQHMLVHTGEKPLECPFPDCPKTFASKGNLDKHMRTHDKTRFEGEPTHICDYCGKGFYILGTLYHHRRKNHLGLETRYQYRRKKEIWSQPCECQICGKQLHSMYALNHHKLRHGEPKFNCEICGKPFYRAPDALDHAKRHEPTWLYKLYFRLTCSGCPPEALGFPSKLAIREHWAAVHSDQPLPEQYKKPPKPRRPGFYVCTLCPEGNRPAYAHSGSLHKHKKSFHSGKLKKWKPRGKDGSKRTNRRAESEDEMSTSGSSEDENFDFEKEPEKLKITETKPVRRSVRKTRGDTSNISRLLNDSDHESEVEDVMPQVGTKRVRVTGKTASQPRILRKAIIRTPKSRIPAASKLTASYINKILGGREVRVSLTRADDTQNQPNASNQTRSRSQGLSMNSARTERSVKSVDATRNVARRRGRPPGKRAILEASSGEPAVPVVLEVPVSSLVICTYGTEENNYNDNLIHSLSPTTDTEVEVKEENDQENSEDQYDTPEPLPHVTASSSVPKRPNFSLPMVIHNPLSKNKAANPIIISAPPAATGNSSGSTFQPCKMENENASSGNDENETNETVLGF